MNKAVALGEERSYSFSSTEASEWLESMNAKHQSQSDTSGKLADSELEAVAGGCGKHQKPGAWESLGKGIDGFFGALFGW